MIIFLYDNDDLSPRNIYTDVFLSSRGGYKYFKLILGFKDKWDIGKAFDLSATRMLKDSKKFKHETFTRELV